MLNGTVSDCDSSFEAVLSLSLSTTAAITIAIMERTIPIPILCITLIPFSCRVISLVRGIRTLSYKGIRRIMDIVIALCSIAGGISKFLPMFLFIVMPCLVKKVAGCWKITPNIRSIVHIGNNLNTTLTL